MIQMKDGLDFLIIAGVKISHDDPVSSVSSFVFMLDVSSSV